MKHYFRCKTCNTRVSQLLSDHIAVPDFLSFSDEPLLQSGQYCTDTNGDYYLSFQDKYNLEYHKDDTRLIGCCGPSVDGLPNLMCTCKSEIGREASDCIGPHFITFYATKLLLIADDNAALEKILQLPAEEQYTSEMLLQYGQS